MTIKIRKAKKEEINLLRALAKKTPEVLDTQLYVEEEVTFEKLLKKGVCIVAEEDKKIIGFLLANLSRKIHCSFIVYCIVLPGHRNKGTGSMLMKEYFKICGKNKIHYIDVYAPAFNERSIKFYQKMGLKKGRTWVYLSKSLN